MRVADRDEEQRRPWRRPGIRLRILAWYVVLLSLATAVTIGVERDALLSRLDQHVQAELEQELDEFNRLIAGRSPDGSCLGVRQPDGADRKLPGLASLVRDSAVLLAHRPGRRAVVRTTCGHYVKVTRPGRAEPLAACHLAPGGSGDPPAGRCGPRRSRGPRRRGGGRGGPQLGGARDRCGSRIVMSAACWWR